MRTKFDIKKRTKRTMHVGVIPRFPGCHATVESGADENTHYRPHLRLDLTSNYRLNVLAYKNQVHITVNTLTMSKGARIHGDMKFILKAK